MRASWAGLLVLIVAGSVAVVRSSPADSANGASLEKRIDALVLAKSSPVDPGFAVS